MPSKAKIIKRAITDAIMNMMTPPLVSVVGSLSDSSADKLSKAIAKVIRLFNIGAYKNIRANLNVAFPEMAEDGRRELAFRNAVHTVRFGIDFLRVLKHPEMVKACTIPPDESIREIVDKSAIILCLPHLGNWEIFGQAIPCFGFKAAAVAEMFRNEKLNTLIENARQHNGLVIIPRKGAGRKVIGALREGYSVGFLPDQNLSPADGGVFLDFFGLPAPSSTLPALLAQRLHLPVVVGASVRNADGKFEFHFIQLPKTADEYPANRLRRPSSRRTRRSSANFRNNICGRTIAGGTFPPTRRTISRNVFRFTLSNDLTHALSRSWRRAHATTIHQQPKDDHGFHFPQRHHRLMHPRMRSRRTNETPSRQNIR